MATSALDLNADETLPQDPDVGQDADDEAFLIAAVEKVFDAPAKSTEHESETLRACLVRIDPSFRTL